MINKKNIDIKYQEYKELKTILSQKTEKLKELETNKEELEYLKMIYNVLNQLPEGGKFNKNKPSLQTFFLDKFPELTEIIQLKKEIRDIKEEISELEYSNDIVSSYQTFIALKHIQDEDYDLIELYTQESLNLGDYEKEKQDFIISVFRKNASFICFAERKDLPLLMNILNDRDVPISYEEFDYLTAAEEMYLDKEGRPQKLELEFIRAHMCDQRLNTFIDKTYPKEEIIYEHYPTEEEMKHYKINLEKQKDYISKKAYIRKKYLLLLLENNIEDFYLNANEEEQKEIMDAYIELSYGTEIEGKYLQYRTASPIINQEVLKKKR